MTHIDAESRALCERFWTRKVQTRFNLTPPTLEEEIAFIDDFLAAGVLTVPLPDGSEATITGDTNVALELPPPAAGSGSGSGKRRPAARPGGKVPLLKAIVGIGMIGAAVLLLVGPMLFQPRAARPAVSEDGELVETLLPSGVDALISSGDVRLSTSSVVPNTLEILPADGEPGVTFVVVPVEVELAEWPCPVAAFKGQPGACWIAGTVVNYLIGLPYDAHTAGLAARLHSSGGSVRLRLSTERAILFQVAEVLTVARQQTEVLAQRRFALTMPLLNQTGGEQRIVIVAHYDPTPDLGGVPAQNDLPPPSGLEVGLGEGATVGAVEVLPTGIHRAEHETRVTLAVWNHAAAPLNSAGWHAVAHRADGAVLDATVTETVLVPGSRAEVVLTTPGPAVAWQLTLPEGGLTISTP